MSDSNKDVLSVLGEAVVIARNKRIVFSNSPAVTILGGDPAGKKLSAVLGADIADMQSDEFTANILVNGKNCIVRSSRKSGDQILIINETKYDNLQINDSALYSLRSMLMVMSMSVDRCRKLAGESGSEEMLSNADSMSKNLASLSRLISNVSIIRAVQSQTLRFTPKVMDLSRLFKEYTDIAASLLPDVTICFEASESLYASVDESLLKPLLTNLIANSVLHGKCRKLRIRLIDSVDYVILAVNDDGCGIRNEDLYNVFERYCDPIGLIDINRGAGLGLSVVLGIARLHSGTVLLESRADHGTAVRVSFRKNTAGSSLYTFRPSTENTNDILTGLADCVDERRFRETYSEF